MNRGKKKCEILKTIRCQVAKKNGIPYTYTECTYQGECRGTCPKCEEELRYLTRELDKLKQSGKQVAVAGVAAAVIASSVTGCASEFLIDLDLEKHATMGVPAYTQQEELDGDVAYPPIPEENVTMGEPVFIPPTIDEIILALQRGESADIYRNQEELRNEWAEWLSVSGEVYDIYEYNETQIRIIYDRNGSVAVIELLGMEDLVPGEVVPEVTAQEIPELQNVEMALQRGEEVCMDFERVEVQNAWARWLAGCGEDYDIFTFTFAQILVIYDGAGRTDSVTLFATSLADMKQTAEWKLLDEIARELKRGGTPSLEGYQRSELYSMWKNYRVEYGDDYDVYRCGEIAYIDFIVVYDEDGMVDSVALYAGITTEDVQ